MPITTVVLRPSLTFCMFSSLFYDQFAVICVISGFRREVDENCVLPGCYAASGGDLLPTFRDNISVTSSGVKN
jgi:hypothetical protein